MLIRIILLTILSFSCISCENNITPQNNTTKISSFLSSENLKTYKNNSLNSNSFKIFMNNSTNENKTTDNQTELCERETSEILKLIFDPKNANRTPFYYKELALYSGIGLNNWGDYSSCIKDERLNYVSVSFNIPGLSGGKFGLCFYKECNATYFNKAKNNLDSYAIKINNNTLIGDNLYFSNPRENSIIYREEKKTGFTICMVILGIIASFSIIKLFISDNKKTEENINKINEESLMDNNNSKQNLLQESNYIKRRSQIEKIKFSFINFLEYFNLIKNANAISNISNPNKTFEYLRAFDGVRFLSTCWVLWGHTYLIILTIVGIKNPIDSSNASKKFYLAILTNAILSVDVFFYLSGFLLYFNLQKYIKPTTNKIQFFFLSLFQRYLRLLPFNLIAIFVVTYSMPYFLNGAKGDFLFGFLKPCEEYWWANLLYIQNFIDYKAVDGGRCVGHSWYLCDDMIYFIVSTIIILFVYNKKLLKNLLFVFLFIFSIIWQLIRTLQNNYTVVSSKSKNQLGDFFTDFYIHPIARLTPYLLGILYCELFFETDVFKSSLKKNDNEVEEINIFRKINIYLKKNNMACFIIFIISYFQVNFGIFIGYFSNNYEIPRFFDIFLVIFNKNIFIIGLGNILHLVFLEKFEFIKNFLSLNIFTILSRITYGVYLLHYYVIIIFFVNTDSSYRLDFFGICLYVPGLIIITLIFSYVLGIFFESPVVNMLKIFKKGEDSKKRMNRVKPQDQLPANL